MEELNQKADCGLHKPFIGFCGVQATFVVNSLTFWGIGSPVRTFFSTSAHQWDALLSVTDQSLKYIVKTKGSAKLTLCTLEYLTDEESTMTRSDTGALTGAVIFSRVFPRGGEPFVILTVLRFKHKACIFDNAV